MKRARQRKKPEKITKKAKIKTKKVKKVKKNKKNKKKVLLTLFIIIIVSIFAALGLGGGNNALIPLDTSTGKMNVLLLGTDKDGLRTDAIMVASYDFDDESLKLLSIPRDTKMYVTNKKRTRKMTEIHAIPKGNGEIMGAYGTIEAVTALTGIPINYYVEFSFDAIDHMADLIGPITFDVPDIEGNGKGMNYDDPYQDLHIHFKPGVQEISGKQVQEFLRYRKSNSGVGDGGDAKRVSRQQDFVKAIIDQKVNLSLIVKAPDMYNKLKKDIKTNFSVNEIARYSTHLLKLTTDKMTSYSLPGEDKHTSAWYFECDFDQTRELIENEFEYDASNITNKVEITGEKINFSSVNELKKEDDNADNDVASSEEETKKDIEEEVNEAPQKSKNEEVTDEEPSTKSKKATNSESEENSDESDNNKSSSSDEDEDVITLD